MNIQELLRLLAQHYGPQTQNAQGGQSNAHRPGGGLLGALAGGINGGMKGFEMAYPGAGMAGPAVTSAMQGLGSTAAGALGGAGAGMGGGLGSILSMLGAFI